MSYGNKRTIASCYAPTSEIMEYLIDMQDAIRYALQIAYKDMVYNGRIPSPIQLRRETKAWFYGRFDYARHHINPVCRIAVAILKSSVKNNKAKLGLPVVRRLAMRIDTGLFKLVGDRVRITLRPKEHIWIPINIHHKSYVDYSKGKLCELLLTDSKVCLTYRISIERTKSIGASLIASDLNFRNISTTEAEGTSISQVKTHSLARIVQIQNDFSRRRRSLQLHVTNPQKRWKKLNQTKGRQRNRIRDALHKLSSEVVMKNPHATFIFEDLRHIRKGGLRLGKKFRTYLNRWPYRMYQMFVEYKSPNKTLHVNPRGTSSECPVCGGKLEHPTWAISRCNKCGVDYDRDRLASLAILCRGLRLCGRPFAVSADASWHQKRSEYLYVPSKPEAKDAGWTDATSAPNGIAYESAAPETENYLRGQFSL